MITKIEINKAVMFDDATPAIDDLKKFNYFFGVNGTGKTTISRVIEDSTAYPDCNVVWEDGFKMEARVYNRDFVEHNFNPQNALKGVFTLGKQEAETLTKIEETKSELDKLKSDIANQNKELKGDDGNGGKQKELADLEEKYATRFFVPKQKYADKLGGAMKGFMGSREDFKNKVLSEATSNTSDLKPLAELEAQEKTVFSDTLAQAPSIPTIKSDKLLALETAQILAKRVIGKDDVDIAAIIKKLGNSDWVRQGRSYYKDNDGICPFCQQKTTDNFANSLNEYFDDTFEQDNTAINTLATDYATESNRILQQVQVIIDRDSEFIDNDRLKSEKQFLESKIGINTQRLTQKQKEPSQVFELEPLQNCLDEIVKLIDTANKKITLHNNIFQNIKNEREKHTGQVWRFIVDELKNDIDDYNTQKNILSSTIDNKKKQLQKTEAERGDKEKALQELEKKSVSIQPTIDAINELLVAYGFKSFKLAKGSDDRTYKLVRENGSDAQGTLSEGEKNFVTFLYFYYLLEGSQSETGIAADKIVVFDDPVSSLDSDVLFIVSTLIRELIDKAHKNEGAVKQVFVLTHNVYFHKELTFNQKCKADEESFWLVRKQDTSSTVEKCAKNPITTAYELLWNEVRSGQHNNATIQNTLRRILESYFKVLGGIPLNKLYTHLKGDDLIKCKDLCSWVNAGSHSYGMLSEEYCSPVDDATVNIYLQVFKKIFEKCGQLAHYNMMMRIDSETENENEI